VLDMAATAATISTTVPPVAAQAEWPTWRGWMHAAAFVVAVPAGVMLIVLANGPAATASAAIYAATVVLLFGTSAAYHRLARAPRTRAVMQRLDHSMIYLLIAGTYVPMCLVALPLSWGIPVLAVVGVGAVTGIVLKVSAFHRARWVSGALYPVLGWALLAAVPVLSSRLSAGQLALVAGGGIAYTVGFPVLLVKRPDPWPRRFGYHEVWHTCTVVAAVLHFAAVATVVA
jgi:hemolysin III